MHKKGQSSLEQLLVTGLALAFIAVIFFFAVSYASDGMRAALAKDSVDKIANAVEHVHSLGPGSKEIVKVYLPDGMEEFTVDGNRIYMRVSLSSGSTEVYQNVNPDVLGTLPQYSGPQDIEVMTLPDGRVLVGGSYLGCSQQSITRSFNQGDSGSNSFSITNLADFQITGIAAVLSGNINDMTTLTQPPASLNPGASGTVGLGYVIPLVKTPGTYSGAVLVNGSNSSLCAVSVTIIVNKLGGADSQGPIINSLVTTPSSPTIATPITVNATGDDSTTGNSSILTCQIQMDLSGIWNTMAAVDGNYNSPTESLGYSVGTLTAGTHRFDLRCADIYNNIGAISTTYVTVGGGADTTGPVVTNLSSSPSSPTTMTPVIVSATGSDSGTGNSNISMCQISLDGAPTWSNMTAVGGAYNTQITQNVNYSLGTLSAGSHIVSVRCIDSYGNIGSAQNYPLTVIAVADTLGPIVTFITNTPINATINDSVIITATASDSTTGGSNITMCQISLDGAPTWNNMTSNDNQYNHSENEVVFYNVGFLAVGTHNVSVRCIDSANNLGNATVHFFNVTDNLGPITSNIAYSPNPAYTNTAVTITATGSDSTTGGGNITMCQIRLNANPTWNNMAAVGGSYGTQITQNVDYAAGTLGAGTNIIYIRCTDNYGNIGPETNYSFTILPAGAKNILIITAAATPTASENYWINWIATRFSEIGFSWSYTQVAVTSVTSGATNISNYRIVVMPNYYPNGNTALDTRLTNYMAAGHEVVLLGSALNYGPQALGYGTGQGGTQNRAALKVQASHYVSTGYTIGNTYSIHTASQSIYTPPASWPGTNILSLDNNNGRQVMGDANHLNIYGPTRPDLFIYNGDKFGIRVIDHALNSSIDIG